MLLASDVKLADPLKKPLAGIGAQGQSALATALGKLRMQATESNRVSGRPQGTYQDFALNQAGEQAGRGINDALYGALGGVSYQDLKNQKEYERQMALAKEIGDKMSPSVAEEILGGLTQGVNLASKGKGIYDALGQSKPSGGGSNPLSLGSSSGFDPSMVSYNPDPYGRQQSYDWWSGGGY